MNKSIQKINNVGHNKHISVPIREWNNNHYSFNKKNEILSLPYINTSNEMIKTYLNLSHEENSTKSKRMRDLIKRSTPVRIFNSGAQVKQNSDNINLGIYVFNKEALSKSKNLYITSQQLDNYRKINIHRLKILNKITFSKVNLTKFKFRPFKLVNKNNIHYAKLYNKNINFYYKDHRKSVRQSNRKIIFKYKYSPKALRLKSKGYKNKKWLTTFRKFRKSLKKNFLRRRAFFKLKKLMLQSKRNVFYNKIINGFGSSFISKKIKLYKKLLWQMFCLSVLKINNLKLKMDNENLIIQSINGLENFLKIEKPDYLTNLKKEYDEMEEKYRKILLSSRKRRSSRNKNKNKKAAKRKYLDARFEYLLCLAKFKSLTLNKIVIGLYDKNNGKIDLNKLYNKFLAININRLFKRIFNRQFLMISQIYPSYINVNKSISLVNNLKYILNKIYNKRTNLNITNLKYSHLNGDIFAKVIEMKLVNKKNRLGRIMKKAFKLIKLSDSRVETNPNKRDTNLYGLINDMFKGVTDTSSLNMLGVVSKKEKLLASKFNNKLLGQNINSIDISSKTKEVFKNIKYKWTTGVKLEAKGRLTTRYQAARALHKYKMKGNLRNKLQFISEDYLKPASNNKWKISDTSTILFRGIHSPNIQYTKKTGLRKIGSFGLKIWINNN